MKVSLDREQYNLLYLHFNLHDNERYNYSLINGLINADDNIFIIHKI